ncbi:pilus assembly FimT family protein [Rhodopirellula sallentina]|uniref:Protein containing Prepilin-type cleavage/methylation n=1 Tax=Rhodopirellula sallentina SM41 TaxID=1263870 RepID=M5UCE2_9BACT|nr:prepilin-type N-terminal cleavage/methylation domain-containing protein [Rhodopirellula sallentina]EMI55526.1 protein containing Prepilin-type cleavage/methylation [Rhodopirellula sallentina SM41]
MLAINQLLRKRTHRGFTLVELLVVLLIFMILVSVSLPIVKGLISDQKVSRTAQSIEAFVNAARSRAIGEGRTVGVRFERLGDVNFRRSTSVRLRQLLGVPAYSGDSADATATLTGSPISSASFDTADSPLVYLSSELLNDTPTDNDHLAPIQVGDMLELAGGRTVAIGAIGAVSGMSVPITFDLSENFNPTGSVYVDRFPLAGASSSSGGRVKYRIHRSPVPSSSNVLSLPKGMAIDLNYSGIGLGGSEFAPDTSSAVTPRSVDILFNSEGAVTQVIYDTANTRFYPTGLIFFCLGEVDGVASIEGAASDRDSLFAAGRTLTTNIRKPDSLWLVINPASGVVSTVAMASVNTIPTDPTDPNDGDYGTALQEARLFATYSDTIAE